MDATDIVTLSKLAVMALGIHYAASSEWSYPGIAAMFGALMLAAFLWGFESVMPYEGNPWGQFIAAGLPLEVLHTGAVGGLFGCAVFVMLMVLIISKLADADERQGDSSGRASE